MANTRRRTRAFAILCIFALIALAQLLTAGAAQAHAVLTSSTPASGEAVPTAPANVELTFSEPVSLAVGYVQVVDEDGERVDTGVATTSSDKTTISVDLESGLPDGGYVVSYRVVSADSHPVEGAIGFAVGEGALPGDDAVVGVGPGSGLGTPVGIVYLLAKWAGYIGLALIAGSLLVLWLQPRLRELTVLRRVSFAGIDTALAACLVAGFMQGPYAAGRGLDSVIDTSLLAATVQTTIGKMLAVRLIALGVIGIVLWELFHGSRRRRGLVLGGGALVVAVAATYAISGHSIGDDIPALSMIVDVIHLSASSFWVGAVAVLLLALYRAKTELIDEVIAAARQFSPIAIGLVAAVVVTGVIQAVIRVGGFGALTGTAYGITLIVKVVAVVVVLLAAVVSLRLTRRTPGAHDPDILRPRLRRSLLIETAVLALVVAAAAVLATTAPARDVYSVSASATAQFDNDYTVQVSVEPGRAGPNVFHFYAFDRDGQVADIGELSATARDAKTGVTIELTLRRVGEGHFIADSEVLSASQWDVTIRLVEPGFGEVEAQTSVEIT